MATSLRNRSILTTLLLTSIAIRTTIAFADPAETSNARSAPDVSSPPSGSQLAEARRYFEAGLKLMKEQLFQEALASFIEANRISPRESIQNNVAVSYRNLKDFASAYGAYEELLSRYGDKMKPAAKADAERARDELGVLTGVITIKVQEPDVRVTLDGKPFLAKSVRVNMGSHAVMLWKPGFETLTVDAAIHGHDEFPVEGPLVKEVLTGHVNVIVSAAQIDTTAKVIVDGNEVGPAPWQSDLEPGVHTIEAKGETTVATAKQIDVVKKGAYEVTLELKPAEGTMAINTGTVDAQILVDGKPVARGTWEGSELVGKHDLSVSKLGFLPYRTSFIMHFGERLTENVQLQPERPAEISSSPPHDWKGVYSQLNLVGMLPPGASSNDIEQGRGSPANAQISAGYGGGLNIRVGYSFGIIGIEAIVLGSYDHSSAAVTYGADTPATSGGPHTENYDFHRFGGSGGLGLRFMSKTQTARPTFGLGGGVSAKGAIFHQTIPASGGAAGSAAISSNVATYIAPMIILDAGIQLGSTPGTRFFLGAMMLAEFPGGALSSATSVSTTGTVTKTKSIDLANGTDIFFGPVLGMQFGE